MPNGSLILILISVVGCAAIGCDNGATPTQSPTPPAATTESVATAPQPRYGWYQTRGEKVGHVLVTKLTIPGLFEEKTDEIRIARYVRVDAEGMMQSPPDGYFGMAHAHGRNEKGGFGYGGAISVIEDEEHDDTVVLDVSYYWTTPDQVKGQLKEKVRAKIGAPLDVRLPSGSRLQVTWRAAPSP